MTKHLRISEDLKLPLDWITMATVVYGARGSGKTTLGAVMAEEVTAAKQRFCAIDLKGDWYGLKSSSDGKAPGIPAVVFGGDHADLPLEEGAGAFVGETVAELEQSVILDLEHLSKGKQVRFLGSFFAALYDRNRDPLLMLLDEAQRYAPQMGGRGQDPAIQVCLGAVEDVVKLGRKHGLGVVLFTQRGSGLNKEVSELCDLLVAFRTPGPLDQGRILDWLDANATKAERDAVMSGIAGLQTGSAVFASGHPDLKLFGVHRVRRRQTFDSSATPKVGERRREPKMLAAPDLAALKEKMAAAIERAKAEDPKALRAELAAAKKAVGAEQVRAAALAVEVERVEAALKEARAKKSPPREVPALTAKDRAALERSADKLHTYADRMEALAVEARAHMTEARRVGDAIRSTLAVPPPPAFTPPSRPAAPQPAFFLNEQHATHVTRTEARRVEVGPRDPEVGTGALSRVMIALAQRPQGMTRRQTGTRAGVSSTSSTFSNNMTKAKKQGWIEESAGLLRITESGLAALGSYEPLPTGSALLEYWLNYIGRDNAAGKVLAAIAAARGEPLTRQAVGEAAEVSHTSSTFSNNLTKLKHLELVHVERDSLRASAELFDDGGRA